MKPTKILSKPTIEHNGHRGFLVFETDTGLMTVKDIGKALGMRPASWYERYRRKGWKSKNLFI